METRPVQARPKGTPPRHCDTPDCRQLATQQIRAHDRVQHLCDEHVQKARAYWQQEAARKMEEI